MITLYALGRIFQYRFTHIVNLTRCAGLPLALAIVLLRVHLGDRLGFMLFRHIVIISRRAA